MSNIIYLSPAHLCKATEQKAEEALVFYKSCFMHFFCGEADKEMSLFSEL